MAGPAHPAAPGRHRRQDVRRLPRPRSGGRTGLNGQAACDRGPVKVTFDVSPPDGEAGVLLGFVEGGEARRWQRLPDAERRRTVLDCFVRYFGPRAADPVDYLEKDWSAEEFTRGCYGAHFAPGVWTGYGDALRPPVGRIHWAGAEYATTGTATWRVRSARARRPREKSSDASDHPGAGRRE